VTDGFDVVRLAEIAAGQWGLVTTAQARVVGGTPLHLSRLAASGALERLRHGVYRIVGTPPTAVDPVRAAWLSLQPSRTAADRLADSPPEVVSHRTAALLHRLGDLDADRIEFSVQARRQSRRGELIFHRRTIERAQWSVVDGLPVSTVTETVVQLTESRLDGGHLGAVIRDALTDHRVDPAGLAAALAPFAHRYGAQLGDGRSLLAELLAQSGESAAEIRTLLEPPSSPRGRALAYARSVRSLIAEELGPAGQEQLARLDITPLELGIAAVTLNRVHQGGEAVGDDDRSDPRVIDAQIVADLLELENRYRR
jgi:hypothetical protein